MKRTAIATMLAISLMGTSALADSSKKPVISSQSVAEDANGASAKDAMRLLTLIVLGFALVSAS